MVPNSEFEQYRAALHVSAQIAEAAIKLLMAQNSDQATIERCYNAVVWRYGEAAAQVALEFYTGIRADAGIEDGFEPRAYASQPSAAADAAIAAKGGATLPMLAGKRVMESADETLLRNAARDPAHPKWAIVAHAGACGWCRMLASNGFVYSTEGSAQLSRHDDCRCAVCVDFAERPALEGYDPDVYAEQYKAVRAQSVAEAKELWESMSSEEREAANSRGKGGYDHVLRNRLAANMNKAAKE